MCEAKKKESQTALGQGPNLCPMHISETKSQFHPPTKKKPFATRARRLEQFLWQEFYDEYKRHNNQDIEHGDNTTEYYDGYCKNAPAVDEERQERLTHKYPVYSTTAVTVWNHHGDVTKSHKKKYSITRPLHECPDKFAM